MAKGPTAWPVPPLTDPLSPERTGIVTNSVPTEVTVRLRSHPSPHLCIHPATTVPLRLLIHSLRPSLATVRPPLIPSSPPRPARSYRPRSPDTYGSPPLLSTRPPSSTPLTSLPSTQHPHARPRDRDGQWIQRAGSLGGGTRAWEPQGLGGHETQERGWEPGRALTALSQILAEVPALLRPGLFSVTTLPGPPRALRGDKRD